MKTLRLWQFGLLGGTFTGLFHPLALSGERTGITNKRGSFS